MVLLGVTAVSQTAADVTSDDISQALRKNLNHPYLYFTEEEKSVLIERTKNNSESNRLLQRMTAECNRLLHTPAAQTSPQKELNPDYEESDELLIYMRNNIRNAHLLAFLYQMTGEGELCF